MGGWNQSQKETELMEGTPWGGGRSSVVFWQPNRTLARPSPQLRGAFSPFRLEMPMAGWGAGKRNSEAWKGSHAKQIHATGDGIGYRVFYQLLKPVGQTVSLVTKQNAHVLQVQLAGNQKQLLSTTYQKKARSL